MRTSLALLALSACLTSCALLDGGREELVATIVLYEEECENLGRIADEVDALERTVGELRSGIRRDLFTLRGLEGCAACADDIGTAAGSTLADRPVVPMPIKPRFAAPASASDRKAELEDRLTVLKMSRDELRARAEERSRLEVEVEILLGARASLGGPVCGHSDCKARLASGSL